MAHGQDTSTEQGAPGLCASGCGFYGSATTNNMCFKCYLGHQGHPLSRPSRWKEDRRRYCVLRGPGELAGICSRRCYNSEALVAEAVPAKKVAPTRCIACKKKVGLLVFACRCGGTFCLLHRYIDGHACNFDYKKADREKIAEQNPLVVASKITKI